MCVYFSQLKKLYFLEPDFSIIIFSSTNIDFNMCTLVDILKNEESTCKMILAKLKFLIPIFVEEMGLESKINNK